MTYRFILFSEDVENFVMEIKAPPTATFLELHQLIQESCNFTQQGDHQFLICNDNWKVKERIHLTEAGNSNMDEDLYLMESTILEDFIEEEGQHMAYIFDTESKSTLLIEHMENIFGEKAEKAFVSRKKGTAPLQSSEDYSFINDEEILAALDPANASTTVNEDIIGDDSFNEEDIDMEGFEVTEM